VSDSVQKFPFASTAWVKTISAGNWPGWRALIRMESSACRS
jgi:hypothetical protein